MILSSTLVWVSKAIPPNSKHGSAPSPLDPMTAISKSLALSSYLKAARRLSKHGWLSVAIKWVAKKTTQAVAFIQEVKAKIVDATSIPGDFTTNMAFQVPKAAVPAEGKVIESPWGNSILLKAFGTQGTLEASKPLTGYLNVFCVDCGAKGSAQLTGKAAFSPIAGFTKGELGMIVDLDLSISCLLPSLRRVDGLLTFNLFSRLRVRLCSLLSWVCPLVSNAVSLSCLSRKALVSMINLL